MGSQSSQKIIVGCLIYYFIFFLVVTLFTTVGSIPTGGQTDVGYNDPGIIDQNNIYNRQPYCTGRGKIMNFFNKINCDEFEIPVELPTDCESISGCSWSNYTSLFGLEILPQRCLGTVNLTAEGIINNRSEYCDSSTLQNENRCSLYECQWVAPNITGITDVTLISQDISLTTIWENIKTIVSYRVDFGLLEYNFILNLLFNFIFLYLPTIILIIAIYFAFPFAHS